jgi:L-ribulose-5-phosphate 3-epimerase
MKVGICYGCLPGGLSDEAKMDLLKAAGYDGTEVNTYDDLEQARRVNDLARERGLEIHSVMASGHWQWPLSDPDEETRQKGLANIRQSVETALVCGADTVLVVPAVVKEDSDYTVVWDTALKSMRELAGYAQERGVVLAVENVWNKFLLTPREMVQFIEAVGSPAVAAYFDTGNIMAYGFPQVWIRALKGRLQRVHVKDFHSGTMQFRMLLQGSVNFPAVRTALQAVGYDGYLSAELPLYSHYPEQGIHDIAAQIRRIIAGS